METELLLADLEILGRHHLKVDKRARVGDKAAAASFPTLVKVEAGLNRGAWAWDLELTPAELKHLEATPLLTLKPCLFVANLSEAELAGGPHYAALKEMAAARERPVVPILGELEAELQDFAPEERQEFLTGLGLAETGLDRLVRESSRLLGLVTFYTIVGPEVRAWHVPAGTPAPRAAGQVHSDMEKGFIRAEVMPFAALDELGSPARVKEVGLLRVEGRDYLVADGDILLFRFQR